MHTRSIARWQHPHVFLGVRHARHERQTRIVIGLATVMMLGEIVAGLLFGSMALVADGLHMATHAGVLLIAGIAYALARHHADDPRFAFGTGKFGELGGFTSAVVLALIACLIGYEALTRLVRPVPIAYKEALLVAMLGLAVNLGSAWLLRGDEQHAEAADAGAERPRDNNLRAAYVHVLADAATSVLAIVGLSLGWLYGWAFMDPIMGVAGALVIASWSCGLVNDTGRVLLDMLPDPQLAARIRRILEAGGDRVADLHLWRIGPGHCGAIVSLVTDDPQAPQVYRTKLSSFPGLSHITVEVNRCETADWARAQYQPRPPLR
jgi:cation diffusion facilitator family transporter